MAADDDATNGEQQAPLFRLFPEQQPLREPIARRSLTTGYEDKENSLSELPVAKHLPQLNKPWLKSIHEVNS